MKQNQYLFGLLVLVMLISTCFAEEITYPTTIGEMNVNAKLTGSGTITGLKDKEEVKFQTLTFQETEYQKLSNTKEELYINGKTIYPKYVLDEFGNKYVVFTIKENGTFNYELNADVATNAIIFQMDDYQLGEVKPEAEEFLKQSEKVESNSTEIKTLEKNKLTNNSFLESINTTILWVNDYVQYPQNGSTEFYKYYVTQQSAVDTLLNKKGVCDEFSNLAAGMLRAKGIPTKLAIGITFDGKEWGNHAWIEAYHNKFGWIPSDPTFREPGFMDATHIKMGAFSDVTQSLAKAIYPSTTTVTFDTQSKMPEVTIKNKKYFNDVEITTTTTELKTKQWNEVEVKVKNKTNGAILVPVKIKGKTSDALSEIACLQNEGAQECLIADDAKKSVLLNPQETKTVKFKLYPNINLGEQYKIDTNLTLYSLSEPYVKQIEISPGQAQNTGEVIIRDVTPIASEGNLSIQIQLVNLFPEEKNVELSLKGGSIDTKETEKISGLQIKEITTRVEDNNTKAYYLTINTPTSIYSQTIIPAKEEIIAPTPVEIKQTIIEQKIEPQKNEPTTIEKLIKNPIMIFGGLLTIVGILLFALFLVNKRYI